MSRPWWSKKHRERVEQEYRDREEAEQQLAFAREINDQVKGLTRRYEERLEENGFGAAVLASMQPVRRWPPWRRA
jgi:ribosomal protein L6P/L9E